MRARKQRQQGFTLVELMVVVAIIGILAAIGMPQLTKQIKQAETAEPAAKLAEMAKNIQGYIDAHPNVSTDAFDGAYDGTTNGLLNAELTPDEASSEITNVISTLSLPTTSKWKYEVVKISFAENSRLVRLCLKAVLVDTTDNAGEVYYSTEEETAPGWDGHFYRVPYIKGATEDTPAKCGDGATS